MAVELSIRVTGDGQSAKQSIDAVNASLRETLRLQKEINEATRGFTASDAKRAADTARRADSEMSESKNQLIRNFQRFGSTARQETESVVRALIRLGTVAQLSFSRTAQSKDQLARSFTRFGAIARAETESVIRSIGRLENAASRVRRIGGPTAQARRPFSGRTVDMERGPGGVWQEAGSGTMSTITGGPLAASKALIESGQKVRQSFKETGREKDKLRTNIRGLGDDTEKTAKKMKAGMGPIPGIFQHIGWIIKRSLAAALVFGPPLLVRSSIKAFLEFEKAVTQIIVQIPGKARASWGQFADIAFSLSRDLGKSATEITDALRLAVSVGFEGIGDATEVARQSSRLAIASFADIETATQTVTNLLNSYGLAAKDSGRTTDIMMRGWQVAGGEMNIFARGIGTVGSSVAATGASMEDLVAVTALLSRSAAGNSRIFIEAQQAFQQIIAPTGEAGSAMKMLGINFIRTKQGGVDFMNTLLALQKRIKDLGGRDQATIFRMLATIFPEQRGRRAIARFFAAAPESVREVFAAVKNSTGAVDQALDEVNKRQFRNWERLKSTVQRAMISLGFAISEAITPAADKFEQFFSKFEVGKSRFDELRDGVQLFFARFIWGMGVVLSGFAELINAANQFAQIMAKIAPYLGINPTAPPQGAQPGEPYGFASGGIVPGTGIGDKIPAMLEPGEEVLPRNDPRHIRNIRGMQSGGTAGRSGRSTVTEILTKEGKAIYEESVRARKAIVTALAIMMGAKKEDIKQYLQKEKAQNENTGALNAVSSELAKLGKQLQELGIAQEKAIQPGTRTGGFGADAKPYAAPGSASLLQWYRAAGGGRPMDASTRRGIIGKTDTRRQLQEEMMGEGRGIGLPVSSGTGQPTGSMGRRMFANRVGDRTGNKTLQDISSERRQEAEQKQIASRTDFLSKQDAQTRRAMGVRMSPGMMKKMSPALAAGALIGGPLAAAAMFAGGSMARPRGGGLGTKEALSRAISLARPLGMNAGEVTQLLNKVGPQEAIKRIKDALGSSGRVESGGPAAPGGASAPTGQSTGGGTRYKKMPWDADYATVPPVTRASDQSFPTYGPGGGLGPRPPRTGYGTSTSQYPINQKMDALRSDQRALAEIAQKQRERTKTENVEKGFKARFDDYFQSTGQAIPVGAQPTPRSGSGSGNMPTDMAEAISGASTALGGMTGLPGWVGGATQLLQQHAQKLEKMKEDVDVLKK